nr:hypothetical protein L203_04190 [Cryptococcus depauperatus CBS 7841]
MAVQANRHRRPEIEYKSGDWVWLDTRNRMKEFKATDKKLRAATFFPRFQGPYKVIEAYAKKSIYKLDIPNISSNVFNKFHASLLKPHLSSCYSLTVTPAEMEGCPTVEAGSLGIKLLRPAID